MENNRNKPNIPFSQAKDEIVAFIGSIYSIPNPLKLEDITTPQDALLALNKFTLQIDRELDKVFNADWLTSRFTHEDLLASGFYFNETIECNDVIPNCQYLNLFGKTNFSQHFGANQYLNIRLFDKAEIDLQLIEKACVNITSYDSSTMQIECSHLSSALIFAEGTSTGHIYVNDKADVYVSISKTSTITVDESNCLKNIFNNSKQSKTNSMKNTSINFDPKTANVASLLFATSKYMPASYNHLRKPRPIGEVNLNKLCKRPYDMVIVEYVGGQFHTLRINPQHN